MLANVVANIGYRREPFEQRLEIKPGAADDDGTSPLLASLYDGNVSIACEAARGIGVAGRHEAVESMRNAGLLLRRRPRRENAQLAIDLHAVGVDDDAAGMLGNRDCKRGLPASGRARNQDGPQMMIGCAHENAS